MIWVALCCALLLLALNVWRHIQVVRLFRRSRPRPIRTTRLVSILQPILSGDPTLAQCLEHNLLLPACPPCEFLWLVDETDLVAQKLCAALIARHPERTIRLLVSPPPPDRGSPKMMKLVAAVPQAHGDVLCVLDDDTMLPTDGLETCLPYLDLPGVGLAFGLPYYVSFGNFYSRLVSYFVNSHSLLTYLPYTTLTEPLTINGMFYLLRREVYDATGGFASLQTILADDFAVAEHVRSHGYRLAQTPVCHGISTHVSGPGVYFRLLHRWFIFPRETLLKVMPLRMQAVTLLPVVAPLFLVLATLALADGWLAFLTAVCFVQHYAMFAHFNLAYCRRAAPWRWSWLVVAVQVLLPFQILLALLLPQRIRWRGHVMRIERGGGFHFLERRVE